MTYLGHTKIQVGPHSSLKQEYIPSFLEILSKCPQEYFYEGSSWIVDHMYPRSIR